MSVPFTFLLSNHSLYFITDNINIRGTLLIDYCEKVDLTTLSVNILSEENVDISLLVSRGKLAPATQHIIYFYFYLFLFFLYTFSVKLKTRMAIEEYRCNIYDKHVEIETMWARLADSV